MLTQFNSGSLFTVVFLSTSGRLVFLKTHSAIRRVHYLNLYRLYAERYKPVPGMKD